MTTVAVEKRKFKEREKCCWRLFLTIVSFSFVGSVVGFACAIQVKDIEGYLIKQKISIIETVATTVFFVVTTALFFYEASRCQHAMFWEHIQLYTLLVIGISLVLTNAIITNIWLDNKFLIPEP